MKKQSEQPRTPESQNSWQAIESQLRADAPDWAESFRSVECRRKFQATLARLKDRQGTVDEATMHNSRRIDRMPISALVLAACVILAVGGWFVFQGTLRQKPRPLAVVDSSKTVSPTMVTDEDLKPLRATGIALQEVVGTAAQKTWAAWDRKLQEAVEASQREGTQLAANLPKPTATEIGELALTPGRQFGSAAVWLDSRLGQLGKSSMEAATQMLPLRTSKPSSNEL